MYHQEKRYDNSRQKNIDGHRKLAAIAEGGVFCLGKPNKIAAAYARIVEKYRWTLPLSDFTANTQDVNINLMEFTYRF